MKNFFLISLCVCFGQATTAQDPIVPGPIPIYPNGIEDGKPMTDIPTKQLVRHEYVREADLVWSKRVWSTIDLREKINHPLYYPMDEITRDGVWQRNSHRWSLWTIIRQNVINGNLTVFSPYNPYNMFGELDGDQLKYPIYPAPGLNYFTDSVYREKMVYYLGTMGVQSDVPLVDDNGEPIIITENGIRSYVYEAADTLWYTSKDIIQYRIKEDWFFDKERSVMDVRIIAIAPVVYKKSVDVNGVESISGTKELFWLYFPHCRFVFNNFFTYNDKNDSQWMSFDDLFWKRKFNAVPYKSSNTYDRSIQDYKTGTDALHEAQRVKDNIRTIEHDVWDF